MQNVWVWNEQKCRRTLLQKAVSAKAQKGIKGCETKGIESWKSKRIVAQDLNSVRIRNTKSILCSAFLTSMVLGLHCETPGGRARFGHSPPNWLTKPKPSAASGLTVDFFRAQGIIYSSGLLLINFSEAKPSRKLADFLPDLVAQTWLIQLN